MGLMDRLKGAAESVQGATSHMGIGASPEQMELANRAQKLMNSGVDTPAHIDAMVPTGKTDTPGGAENNITVTVKPNGGQPYQATFNQYVYPKTPYSQGEDIIVKVDPSDPQTLMIFGRP